MNLNLFILQSFRSPIFSSPIFYLQSFVGKKGMIVVIFEQVGSGLMHCVVGKKEEEKGEVIWGECSLVGNGFSPHILLTENEYVVQVHSLNDSKSSNNNSSKIYYRLGKLNTEKLKVDWNEKEDFICEGHYPRIAKNSNGVVALSYSKDNNVYVQVGLLDENSVFGISEKSENINDALEWQTDVEREENESCNVACIKNACEACLVLTNSNHLLLSYRSSSSDSLFFTVAKLVCVIDNNNNDNNSSPLLTLRQEEEGVKEKKKKRKEGKEEVAPPSPPPLHQLPEHLVKGEFVEFLSWSEYDTGCTPSLAFLQEGEILDSPQKEKEGEGVATSQGRAREVGVGDCLFEVHKSQRMSSLWGHLSRFSLLSKKIKYKPSFKFDSGLFSSISFLHPSSLVEVHKAPLNDVLWINFGKLSYKPLSLHNLCLSASHNSCVNDINSKMPSLLSQLSSGISLVEIDVFKASFSFLVGHNSPGDSIQNNFGNPKTFQLNEWLEVIALWLRQMEGETLKKTRFSFSSNPFFFVLQKREPFASFPCP